MNLEEWLDNLQPEERTELITSGTPRLVAMQVSENDHIKRLTQKEENQVFMEELIEKSYENLLYWRDYSLNLFLGQLFNTSIDEIKTTGKNWNIDNKAEELAVIGARSILQPQIKELIQFERENKERLYKTKNFPNGIETLFMERAQQGAQEIQGLLNNISDPAVQRESARAESFYWSQTKNPILRTLLKQEVIGEISTSSFLRKQGVAYIQSRQKTADSIALKFAKKIAENEAKYGKQQSKRQELSWLDNPLLEERGIEDFAGVAIHTTDKIVPGEGFSGTMEWILDRYKYLQGVNPIIIKNEYEKKGKPVCASRIRLIKFVMRPDPEHFFNVQLPHEELNPLGILFDSKKNIEEITTVLDNMFQYSFQLKTQYDGLIYHLGPFAHHIYANKKLKVREQLPKDIQPIFDNIYSEIYNKVPNYRL